MSDLVGNPEDRFSHNEAQIKPYVERCIEEAVVSHFIFVYLFIIFVRVCFLDCKRCLFSSSARFWKLNIKGIVRKTTEK